MQIDRPLTMLGVWAHPDDETYLSAALMRRVIAAGGRVTVVCATRGEHGADDPQVQPRDLGARREGELRRALAHLGVHDVRILGYPDGGCADVDPTPVVAQLSLAMRALRPDVVVTFGSDGITNHPDHMAVHHWTTQAWLAADVEARLLYATMTDAFVERQAIYYPEVPLTVTGSPVSVPEQHVALRVDPQPDERSRKRAALSSHASQVAALIDLMGGGTMGADRLHSWWLAETFRDPTLAELTVSAGRAQRRVRSGGHRATTPPDARTPALKCGRLGSSPPVHLHVFSRTAPSVAQPDPAQ